jgi:hypothetical protein
LIRWALEEEGEVEDTTEALAADPEVESDANELMEDDGNMTDMTDTIESTVEDAGTLDEIGDVMEESVESGEGLSQESAKIAGIAISAIAKRLGYPANIDLMPSMEAFGATSSRVTATRIALEAEQSLATRAWDAIKRAVTALYNMVANFIAKILSSTTLLDAYAVRLETAVKAIKADKPKKGDLESKAMALAFGGKNNTATFENAKSTAAVHKSLAENLEKFGSAAQSAVTKIDSILAEIKGAKGETKLEELKKSHEDLMDVFEKSVGGHVTSDNTSSRLKGTTKIQTVEGLVQGKKLRVIQNDSGTTVQLRVEVVKGETPAGDQAHGDTLSQKQMLELISEARQLIAGNKALKASNGDVKKLQGKFEKAIDTAIKGLNKEKENESAKSEAAVMSTAKKTVSAMSSSVASVYFKIPSLNYTAAKALLAYVSASAAQY